MIQNQGAPLTHAKLLRSIWGPEYGNEQEYLRSYVRMLRKKIEDDPPSPNILSPSRGSGTGSETLRIRLPRPRRSQMKNKRWFL